MKNQAKNKLLEGHRQTILLAVGIMFTLFLMNFGSSAWTSGLNSELKIYYKLNETTGTNVLNSVGDNGTITSAMSQLGSVGIIGTAYTTNISSLVNSNIAQGNTALGNVTYAFWFNTTVAGTASGALLAGGTSGNFGHYVDMDAGKLSIDIYNGTAYVCGGSRNMKPAVNFNDGVMRFILFTTNTTHCNLYVNGVLNVSKAIGSNVVRSGGNWQIGWGSVSTTEVTIDELGIWNRSLSQAEITQLYNSGAGITYINFDSYPTITLNSPANAFTSINSNVTFNCTVSDDVHVQNVSLYINGTLNQTNTSGINNTAYIFSTNLTNSPYNWTCGACNNLTTPLCKNANVRNFTVGLIGENSQTYNSSTYETSQESFTLNLSYNSASYSSISANLVYNGTAYAGTKIGTGDVITFTKVLDIPTISTTANKTFYWNVSLINSTGTSYFQSISYNQTVESLLFINCNATYAVKFLNFTFKDETNLSVINATIPTSTFVYWMGSSIINKTLSFTNTTANISNFNFCSNAVNNTIKVSPRVQYLATGYPQRVYETTTITLTNSTTNITLYLLPTTDGIYVTFQVTNPSDQLLSGVTINASREFSGINTLISQGTTGTDGTYTFWLNPDYLHTITFSKSGFTTYVTSITPTQSSYTITLGGGGTTTNDYSQGISYKTYPVLEELFNDTIYNFMFNVSSSYWSLDSFGFNLRLANGTIVGTASSITAGTAASLSYNTTNLTMIYMDYYWIINGNITNGNKYWVISNTANTQYSVKNFFTDLGDYLDSGLFGIDNFGRYLLVFIILFVTVGMMSYKYGLTSPMAITTMIFSIIFFLDVVTGLIPKINNVEYLLTYASGLVLVVTVLKETLQ